MASAVIESATHAELHIPTTLEYPWIVPVIFVEVEADSPTKSHPIGNGLPADDTFILMSPGMPSPTETAAVMVIPARAEQFAVITPSPIPFAGTVKVPLTC